MTPIKDLTSEFATTPKDAKKLEGAFASMVALKSSVAPSPVFRSALAERVVALSAMQVSSFYILKRQNHLLTWVFASLVVVGGSLYIMSDTLFTNPITGQQKTISAPVQQEATESLQSESENISTPISEEEVLDDTLAPLVEDDSDQEETQEAVSDEQVEDREPSGIIDEVPWDIEASPDNENQDENDILLESKNQEVPEDVSLEKETPVEEDEVSNEGQESSSESSVNTSETNGDKESDTIESKQQEDIETPAEPKEPILDIFTRYCSEKGWIYSIFDGVDIHSCTLWGNTCSLNDFKETQSCSVFEQAESKQEEGSVGNSTKDSPKEVSDQESSPQEDTSEQEISTEESSESTPGEDTSRQEISTEDSEQKSQETVSEQNTDSSSESSSKSDEEKPQSSEQDTDNTPKEIDASAEKNPKEKRNNGRGNTERVETDS